MTTGNVESADSLHTEGNNALSKGLFEEALEYFRRALDLQPRHVRARLALSSLMRGKRDYTDALSNIDDGLKYLPDEPWLLTERGNILRELERFDDALECYKQASILHPAHYIAELRAVDLLRALGRNDEFQSRTRNLMKMAPDDPWVKRLGIELALINEGKEAALAKAIEIIRIYPDFDAAYLSAAQLMLDMGKYPEARETLERREIALENNPWFIILSAESAFHENSFENAFSRLRNPRLTSEHFQSVNRIRDMIICELYCHVPLDGGVRSELLHHIALVSGSNADETSQLNQLSKMLVLFIYNEAMKGVPPEDLSSTPGFLDSCSIAINKAAGFFLRVISEPRAVYSVHSGCNITLNPDRRICFPEYVFYSAVPALRADSGRGGLSLNAALFLLFFRAFLKPPDFLPFTELLDKYFLEFNHNQLLQGLTYLPFTRDSKWKEELASFVSDESVLNNPGLLSDHILFISYLMLFAPLKEDDALKDRLLSAMLENLRKPAECEKFSGNSIRRLFLFRLFGAGKYVEENAIKPLIPAKDESGFHDILRILKENCSLLEARKYRRPVLPKQIRIAVCVSGQMRQHEAGLSTWKKSFLRGADFDFFVHSWKRTGERPPDEPFLLPLAFSGKTLEVVREIYHRESMSGFWMQYPSVLQAFHDRHGFISENEIARLYGTSEDHVVLEDDSRPPFNSFSNQQKMYREILSCQELCEQSGTDYDILIRIRSDLAVTLVGDFSWPEILSNLNRTRLIYNEDTFRMMRWIDLGPDIPDKIAVGSPEAMHAYASTYSLYWPIAEIDDSYWGKDVSNCNLARIMWLHGIDVVPLQGFNFSILRSGRKLPLGILLDAVMKDSASRTCRWDNALLEAIRKDINVSKE